MSSIIFDCGCEVPICGTEYSNEKIPVTPYSNFPLKTKLDIYSVRDICEKTWDVFVDSTKGVFQLETQLGQKWSKMLKPRNIEELGVLGSILRPGCLRAMSGDPPKSMTERYVDRKNGLEATTYLHPSLEPILKNTYGILVFQEQAMRIATELAGFNEQETDVLRKAIGKKKPEIMAKTKKWFIKGCKKVKIVPDDVAEEIFSWIQESQKYSFNKSHSDSYALVGYWTAFCKAHFPRLFFCSWLDRAEWKGAKRDEEIYTLVNDAKLKDIEVNTPHIRSKSDRCHVQDDKVYLGFHNIKGIGEASSIKLNKELREAENEFGPISTWSWMDYLVRFADRVTVATNKLLAEVGALDGFEMSRQAMIFELGVWFDLKEKTERAWIKQWYEPCKWNTLEAALLECAPARKRKGGIQIAGGGTSNIKREKAVHDLTMFLKNPPRKLTDKPDLIAWNEQRLLGTSITYSKADMYDGGEANCTCKEFVRGRNDFMKFAVEIIRVKVHTAKKGQNAGSEMAFLTVQDSSCSIDNVVCFPDVWKEAREAIFEGNTILLHGEKTNQGSLAVKKVWQV